MTPIDRQRDAWRFQVDPHDICTDGAGRLYVADGANKRALLVSGGDGRVIRTLSRSPGRSWAVRWAAAHTALLHLYEDGKTVKISVFKVASN